jgi:hypothetical protein
MIITARLPREAFFEKGFSDLDFRFLDQKTEPNESGTQKLRKMKSRRISRGDAESAELRERLPPD